MVETDRDRQHQRCDRRQRGGQAPVAAAPPHETLDGAGPSRPDRPVFQESPQVLGQGLGRAVPLRRVLLQALQGDRLQVARRARHQPRRRHRLGRLDLLERLQDRRPPERRTTDQEFVQDHAQRVDVGERADLLGLALGLLGGHVAGRAQDRLGRRQARFDVQALGQAEVGDLGRAVGGDQDVGRLQVAVDDPQPVRLDDGAGQGLDQRRRPPRRPGGAVEGPIQAAARHVLQLEER